MIKINLIGDRRPAVARRARPKLGVGGANRSILLLAGGAVLGLLVAGIWWWKLTSQLEDEQAKVNRAKEEVKQLEAILAEVEQFKKKEADLTTRINVIKELTIAQRGPVAIMDGVSRSLPDLVWLQTMSVDNNRVTLAGRAMNTNAIASFIENLAQVPEFREPETRDIAQIQVDNQPIFRFSLTFPYQLRRPEDDKPATPPAADAAAAPAAAPAAGGKRAGA